MAAAAATTGGTAAPAPATPQGSNTLKIVLLVLGGLLLVGILAAVATTIFIGKKIHDAGVTMVEKEGEVKMKLPGMSVETTKDPEKVAASLGVDIYPGARLVEGGGEMHIAGVDSATGVFETDDPPEKVAEFYRDHLPGAMYTAAEGTHTIIAREGKEMITVHIEREGDKTRLHLARTRGVDTH